MDAVKRSEGKIVISDSDLGKHTLEFMSSGKKVIGAALGVGIATALMGPFGLAIGTAASGAYIGLGARKIIGALGSNLAWKLFTNYKIAIAGDEIVLELETS